MIKGFSSPTLFLVVTLGLAWLGASPLWIGATSVNSSTVSTLGLLMMFTTSLGSLAVWWLKHPGCSLRRWPRSTGITLGPGKSRTVALVVTQLLSAVLIAPVINSIPAFAEE